MWAIGARLHGCRPGVICMGDPAELAVYWGAMLSPPAERRGSPCGPPYGLWKPANMTATRA